MRIHIRDERKTILKIWVPSGTFLINIMLRLIRLEGGQKINQETRQKIVRIYRQVRQYHRKLVIADIESRDGTRVYIQL
jgi:hypothetical protein